MTAGKPSLILLERLRPVFETALDAVVAMHPDGTVAEWNPVAERMFGWTRAGAIGQPMSELIVPYHHRKAHIEGIERYLDTGRGPVLGQRLEITGLHRDRGEFPIELAITVTETEGRKLFIGFLRDISERKRAERLLIRQAKESAALFKISRLAAESDSVEPVFQATLQAIAELAEWPVGHALVSPEDRHDELISSGIWFSQEGHSIEALRVATNALQFRRGLGLPGIVLESGKPSWVSDTDIEVNFIRKGLGYGAAFGLPIQAAGRVIAVLEFFTTQKTDPDPELLLTVRTLGEQVGRVLERRRAVNQLESLNQTLEQRVIDRTSELELANEALRQAQKMEAIGQLTGGIAHDFNNFLTVIKGSTDLLRKVDLSDEKRARYIDAIADTADRAARLTSQLLAFARRQALRPEVFDAASRIEGVRDMIKSIVGSRIDLVIETDCRDCFVAADAGQFETALVNLVVNARDAMDGEGELSIRVQKTSNTIAPARVKVTVADTGSGIPSDRLGRIFEPFYTTKEVGKGTGLGLSQVYGFVKQSGGELEVQSDEGLGTEFVLSFPHAKKPAGEKVADRAAHQDIPAGTRVLIVEDNPNVGQFACQLFGDLGCKATLSDNALDALRLLNDRFDEFDVVFSDVVMPGMSGLQLATAIQKTWPRLPVVLTTGYSQAIAEGSNDGFRLLHKPYSADALAQILGHALGHHSSACPDGP